MRRVLAVVALTAALAGCGGHGHTGSAQTGAVRPGPPAAGLTNQRPCPGLTGFTCATLTVPLDHAGQAPGTLRLAVGVQRTAAAPRGVLLFLTGGPGQPGVSFLRTVLARLGPEISGYRLVMFDQRGTGAGALRCPALQDAAGASDLAVVPSGAVAACARAIGSDRRYYSTSETVADIDQLRAALGASRLTLDGVSYGTFVAERYALAHPTRVDRLVLDSVVPHVGVDPTYLAAIQATPRVLRLACAAQHCGTNPGSDLAAVIRSNPGEGPRLLDALVADSVGEPSFFSVPQALHAAREGRPTALDGFLSAVASGEDAPAAALSQGLHESTLCLDLEPPWNAATPAAARAAALAAQASRLPASAFYPFDRATATGNGLARGCLAWPATTPPDLSAPSPRDPLPNVPVLLLAGDHDLSTPLAWARAEAATAPDAKLVIVPGSGHSIQLRASNAGARLIVRRFLAHQN